MVSLTYNFGDPRGRLRALKTRVPESAWATVMFLCKFLRVDQKPRSTACTLFFSALHSTRAPLLCLGIARTPDHDNRTRPTASLKQDHGKCFVTTLRAHLAMASTPARLLRYNTVCTLDHGKRARPTAALQHCARLTMVSAPARLLPSNTARAPGHGKRARPTAALRHCAHA